MPTVFNRLPKFNLPKRDRLARLLPRKKHLLTLSAALLIGAMLMPTANAANVVIDVRTPEEFQIGHPDGAINIPHSQIASKIASQGVSKSDTIKLYSRGGARADQAKAALEAAGYTNVSVQQ